MNAVTARAYSNIAFIKYWGNIDHQLRLPENASLSMNLDGVYTDTTVRWDTSLTSDSLIFNGEPASEVALKRVVTHLDMLRSRLGITGYAEVESVNNFPTGAGIASSASAFAALTLASAKSAGLDLAEKQLTTLARIGSGSASRSIPAGFVEWYYAETHEDSYAETFAPQSHWDLVDIVAIISTAHKAVGSKQGHETANTSDLQSARVAGAKERVKICKQAILDKDFQTFATVVEHDSNLMHAVMMTSQPPLFYWQPASLMLMQSIREWRQEGINVCYTLDAGANVHCLCTGNHVDEVVSRLKAMNEIQDLRIAKTGGGAHVLQESS